MKSLIKRTSDTSASTAPKSRWLKRAEGANVLPQFRHDLDRAFDRMWRNMHMSWAKPPMPWPALDIQEDDKSMMIRVDAPGVDPKNLDVELSGTLLTIRGSRESQQKESKAGFQRQERISGSFYRSVTLPEYVDSSKVQARYDKGVLNIQVPKVPGQGPRRITVSS